MPSASGSEPPPARRVIPALGATQILAWGSTYYLPAVLAGPIVAETGWPLPLVVGGLSLGLLTGGMVSPRVGRTIERGGGRPVLAAGSILIAAGLAGLALAGSVPAYLAAWLVMGLGMGAGLYDAAFATLGHLYGREARRAITALTLFGGFASTLCWPLTAFLAERLGWRGACLVYAGLQLGLALPLHLLVLPRRARGRAGAEPRREERADHAGARRPKLALRLLGGVLTLTAIITTTLSVHLLTILQSGGLELAGAVALGALIGPSQVGSRLVEMAFGARYHPIWTMLAATLLIACGIAGLLLGVPIVGLALVVYGLGNGIYSIARGTLPLTLFGPEGYAALLGRLALPALVASALSPAIGAGLLELGGPRLALATLTGLALVNVGLVTVLWRASGVRA